MKGQLAGIQPRQVEDVVDQAQQMFAAVLQRRQIGALVGGQAAVGQQAGHAQHPVQRRAKLVAHGGQVALALVQTRTCGLTSNEASAVRQLCGGPGDQGAVAGQGLARRACAEVRDLAHSRSGEAEGGVGAHQCALDVDQGGGGRKGHDHVFGVRHGPQANRCGLMDGQGDRAGCAGNPWRWRVSWDHTQEGTHHA